MGIFEPPFTRERLIEALEAGLDPSYLFFWGHTAKAGSPGKECLSQWYPASFAEAGVLYRTAEHYMMAGKARLFGDSTMLEAILAAATPAEAKKLGRKVQGFVEPVWKQHCSSIVVASPPEDEMTATSPPPVAASPEKPLAPKATKPPSRPKKKRIRRRRPGT